MEKSLSLAEPLGFLFIHLFLNWFSKLQKLSLRFLSKSRSFTSSNASEEELRLSRAELEMVLERMSLSWDKDDGFVKEYLGCDDLCCMFEEKEPTWEEVGQAFGVFDENCDGFIDAVELQSVLMKLGFGKDLEIDSCRKMIAKHNGSGDGRMDFNQFIKFMESCFCCSSSYCSSSYCSSFCIC